MSSYLITSIAGFFTSLSLIVAIGAQNAFVLRQGLRGEHVIPIIAVCAISDATLIAIGVSGFHFFGPIMPLLTEIARWIGIVFLLVYGTIRFRAAWIGGEVLLPSHVPSKSITTVLVTCFVITWANPHVYLDTVILLGSISAQYHPHQFSFGVGAGLGSIVFFSTLGFGAKILAPYLASVRAWVILEALIGITMWIIAVSLFFKPL